MLFLDLYGVPRAQTVATTRYLPKALVDAATTIADWKRATYGRARMTMRQFDDLQLS